MGLLFGNKNKKTINHQAEFLLTERHFDVQIVVDHKWLPTMAIMILGHVRPVNTKIGYNSFWV